MRKRKRLLPRKAKGRSAITNGKTFLLGVDGRSRSARRFRDLVQGYMAETGGRHEELCKQAASLVLQRELLDAASVSGQRVDTLQLVRLTLAVAHMEKKVATLDCLREVRPPFSPEGVVGEFAQLLKQYRVSSLSGDRYGGEWCREPFQKFGIKYEVGIKPKSDLYRDLLPVINSGKADLLDNDRLLNQLCGLERRTSRAGRDSIDHAPGGHDDLANVCAGVITQIVGGIGSYDETGAWIGGDDVPFNLTWRPASLRRNYLNGGWR